MIKIQRSNKIYYRDVIRKENAYTMPITEHIFIVKLFGIVIYKNVTIDDVNSKNYFEVNGEDETKIGF